MHLRREILILLTLLVAVLPMRALADDGLLEINQVCAEGDGCFSGDTPGFPVEITASGSYAFTSTLSVPADTDGIVISADDVSIDFNGFAIEGPVTCTGEPVTSCGNLGSNSGIDGNAQSGVKLFDGKVSGFNSQGVYLGERASLRGLTVSHNTDHGIILGRNALVEDVQSISNNSDGIIAGDRSIVRSVVARGNGSRGLDLSAGVTVFDSVAALNGDHGIFVGSGSTVRGVLSHDNQKDGVVLFNGGSLLSGSTIENNTEFGVTCQYGSNSGLRSVVMSSNNGNAAQFDDSGGTCTQLGTNICQNGTACP